MPDAGAPFRTLSRSPAQVIADLQPEQVADLLQRILGVTDATLADLPLDQLLEELMRRLQASLGVDVVRVLLCEPDGSFLRVRASLGLDLAPSRNVTIPPGMGLAGRVARDRVPFIVDDVFRLDPVDPAVRVLSSAMVAPLLVDGRLTGVLKVGTFTPRRFAETDLSLLQLVADRIGLAIDRALRHQQLEAEIRARIDAQDALQYSEDRFRHLVEAATDYGILLLNPDGEIASWNQGAERLTGYAEAEIVGHHVAILYPTEEVEAGAPVREIELVRSAGRLEREGWRVRRNGEKFRANVITTSMLRGGEVIGFATIVHDLTVRRTAQEQLRRSEERFRLLVESVRDYAIFALDVEGRILSWNVGAERIKGYSAEDVIGKHFSLFYTEPDRLRDYPAQELEQAIRFGHVEDEGWRVRKNGTLFWANVVITALRSPDGDLVGFAKVTRDLSERKRAEDTLRESEARLTRIVASAMDAIITTDENRRIVLFNRAAERLFGVSAAQATGSSLDRFVPPRFRSVHAQHMRRFGETGVTSRSMHRAPGALPALHADGTEFPVEATISQAVVGGERLFTVVLRDVTERLRADEARERALHAAETAREAAESSNRTKSNFMAMMSHELRTPINAMIGYTDLLRMGVPEPVPEASLRHVERIQLSARHLLQLIEEMLTFARLEAGKEKVIKEEVMLPDVLGEVAAIVEPSAAAKALDFRIVTEVQHGTIVTDPRKLRQILLNLLGNAVKFTRSGHVELRVLGSPGELILRVSDTGIGIAPEHRDRLFEAFWQADASLHRTTEGTGLGLAIVHRFVEMLGGTVEVDTEIGRGSSFTVRLPLVD